MGQATTPAGVETADGPQQLTPRHAEAGQAQTGRHSHHEVCYRAKAAVPWCLQGTAHCTEREPNRNATVICVSVTRAPPVSVCESQQQAEAPPRANPPPPWGAPLFFWKEGFFSMHDLHQKKSLRDLRQKKSYAAYATKKW